MNLLIILKNCKLFTIRKFYKNSFSEKKRFLEPAEVYITSNPNGAATKYAEKSIHIDMACAKRKARKGWKASALRFESANPFQFSFIARASYRAHIIQRDV